MVIKASKKQKANKIPTRIEKCKLEEQKLDYRGHLDINKKDQVSEAGTIRLSEASKNVSQGDIESNNDPKNVIIHEENKENEDKMLILQVFHANNEFR